MAARMAARMADHLSNRDARRVFLSLHGLGGGDRGRLRRSALPDLVERLGFVQLDSIRTVERAHHHIIATRTAGYRADWLNHHIARERTLFENWTHDASVIPTAFFPYWKPRFRRAATQIMRYSWWRERLGDDHEGTCRRVLELIGEHGPVTARMLTARNPAERSAGASRDKNSAWWGWGPSKAALTYLWRTGAVSVTAREGFQKVYDLTERVIPDHLRAAEPDEAAFIDWNCRTALTRLGFAGDAEIARFWDGISTGEAQAWRRGPGRDHVRPLEIEGADGTSVAGFGQADLFQQLRDLPPPPSRVRFLSPFDPLVRDRKRVERLFGFHFRIEIYVPEANRRYGYYVYPMLERDRLIGRIEMRTNRDADTLEVRGLWMEPEIRQSKARRAAIEAELDRWRRHVGLAAVTWQVPRPG